jgi:hypothetical protein
MPEITRSETGNAAAVDVFPTHQETLDHPAHGERSGQPPELLIFKFKSPLKPMKNELLDLPITGQSTAQGNPEGSRVRAVLLDRDNLPIAQGSAVLPLSLGVGVFWPDSPMPPSARLLSVKCLALPGGELLHLKSMTLREGQPPHYDFVMALG